MINKRLLIKNLLAHNDESSFYDKKRQLNLHTREGKAKFLKHICALSNSNPTNNSYIVVGVEDHNNEIVGDDFFDDSHIQNLVNAFLENPPKIQYENVPFPNLPKDKVVGLVTIKAKSKTSHFKKGIHTIHANSIFIRRGSNTVPVEDGFEKNYQNAETVIGIENNSRNNIEYTLDGVIDFMNFRHKDMAPKYKVFKELFVICWAGVPKKVRDKTFLSRVDIELINEQIKLFYSAQDVVTITYDEDTFNCVVEFPSLIILLRIIFIQTKPKETSMCKMKVIKSGTIVIAAALALTTNAYAADKKISAEDKKRSFAIILNLFTKVIEIYSDKDRRHYNPLKRLYEIKTQSCLYYCWPILI